MASDVHEMLRKVLAREPEGYAWLYDRFAPRLLRRLGQRYGFVDGMEPVDLLQDAYLFFLQNDHRVLRYFLERVPRERQSEVALARHLWDLACGVATNRRRSAALRRTSPLGPAEEPDSTPSSERSLIDRDRLARLDDCLRRSGRRVYLYFKLRYVDGLTPEEIAEATGWSRRATYKLKQALNKAVEACAESLDISVG